MINVKRFGYGFGLGLLLSTGSLTAFAQTALIVSDGGQVEADISLQHPTRLSLKYDGGDQLIFNQPEGATPEVAATVDEKGDVYLSVVEGHPGQVVSGFLTTEGGRTYLVKLTVKNKQADQYEIISREAKDEADKAKARISSEAEDGKLTTVKWSNEASYHNSIARLMQALYYDHRPEGFVRKRSTDRRKVEGLSLKSVRYWSSENVEALIYEVRNDNPFFVNPSLNVKNYRPYVAISFTTDSLEPGETGRIYVLRKSSGS